MSNNLYFLKRALWFLPTLFVVAVLTFWLSMQVPGDPITFGQDPLPTPSSLSGYLSQQQSKKTAYERLGLHKPWFYVSVQPLSFTDTLHRIQDFETKQTLLKWLKNGYTWPQLANWPEGVQALYRTYYQDVDQLPSEDRIQVLELLSSVRLSPNVADLGIQLDQLQQHIPKDSVGSSVMPHLAEAQKAMSQQLSILAQPQAGWRSWIPSLHWHGTDNRFHLWGLACLQLDFGKSYQDGRPVWEKIKKVLPYTLAISIPALLLTFGLSIFIGVITAARPGSAWDTWVHNILYAGYAMPLFWVATLLLLALGTPMLGMQWFPGTGIGPTSGGFWVQFQYWSWRMVLPIVSLTYGGLAYYSRQVRNAMVTALSSDYVAFAKARGISKRSILWRHAFPNALFPLITLLAGAIPSMISGSILVEVIFNIPGMGQLMFNSILMKDWNVVFAIVLFGALLTVFGIWFGDLLYSWVNPRVQVVKTANYEA